jgi:hypothetical protein
MIHLEAGQWPQLPLVGSLCPIVLYDQATLVVSDKSSGPLAVYLHALGGKYGSEYVCYLAGGFDLFRHTHPAYVGAGLDIDTSCVHLQLLPAVSSANASVGFADYPGLPPLPHSAPPLPPHSVPNLPVTQVLPGLLLGSATNAEDIALLRHWNVTHIVNVTVDSPECFPSEFKYLTLRLPDKHDADLLSLLPATCDFVAAARASQGTVLVHCKAGISRSPAVILAYLMVTNCWPLTQAFA